MPTIKVSYNPTIQCNFGKSPGSTTPHPAHFHVHLCDNPHIVSQHPDNTAPQTLPCGTCTRLLSNHAIFPPHFKTFTLHHLEAYHAWTPKTFSAPSLCSHFGPFIHCGKFVLLCNLSSTSLTPLSWLSFRYQTGMQVFYITPALIFWFIVVSSVIQVFSFLDRFSLIPPTPTKFHHHLIAWIHSMPVTPGSRPLSTCFGGATHHGFDPKYPSSFIK